MVALPTPALAATFSMHRPSAPDSANTSRVASIIARSACGLRGRPAFLGSSCVAWAAVVAVTLTARLEALPRLLLDQRWLCWLRPLRRDLLPGRRAGAAWHPRSDQRGTADGDGDRYHGRDVHGVNECLVSGTEQGLLVLAEQAGHRLGGSDRLGRRVLGCCWQPQQVGREPGAVGMREYRAEHGHPERDRHLA